VRNKLTLEMVNDLHRHATTTELFQAIQSHTAECVAEAVAEAVAECVKDRYRIGEKRELLSDFWEPVTFGFMTKHGFVDDVSNGSFFFRDVRPVRPLTDEELFEAVGRERIEAMAKDLGVSTTVEE